MEVAHERSCGPDIHLKLIETLLAGDSPSGGPGYHSRVDSFDRPVCHLYRLPVHGVFADFPQRIRLAWDGGHLSAIPQADWSNLARQAWFEYGGPAPEKLNAR